MMEIIVQIGAIYLILLVVFHLFFWKLFRWETQLQKVSSINRGVMQVLNISITLIFVGFAFILLKHTGEILTTGIGNSFLGVLMVLLILRAAQQIVFFKMNYYISQALFAYFVLGAILFGIPLMR